MRRAFVWAGLLTGLLAAVPTQAAQKPDRPGRGAAEPATASDYLALARAGTVVATIVNVSASERSLTLRVESQMRLPGGRRSRRPQVAVERKDFELTATDSAVVRILELPTEYDDRGFPRKYTPEEIKKLKGTNPKLPGYTFDFEKLKPGHIVQATVVMPKPDKGAAEARRPKVSLIVVTGEGPDPNPRKRGKK